MLNGVLTVAIAKSEASKPNQIAVKQTGVLKQQFNMAESKELMAIEKQEVATRGEQT
jgi:hypothetical protein